MSKNIDENSPDAVKQAEEAAENHAEAQEARLQAEKAKEEEKEATGRIDIKAEADAKPEENSEEKTEEKPEEKPEEASEEKAEEPKSEAEYSAAEGTDASLLSEFAPKPMNIPHVDLEKEKKKQEKRKQNQGKEKKKVEARKNKGKKKRSKGKKIAAGIAAFFIFVALTAAMTGLISILSVHITTGEYAFRAAVKNSDIAEITIGSVRNYERLGMNKCSGESALVDIIKDNSDVSVTYKEIISSVRSSSVNDFLAGEMKAAADYLLSDKPYTAVTGSEIASVIKDNSTLVRNLTGRTLTDEDYTAVSAYFEEYGNMSEISAEALDGTLLKGQSKYVKHLMSLKILGALLLLCILLIILLCVVSRGTAHVPLGWSFILSGIAVILGAVFFRPSYSVSSRFLQTLLNNYFNFFTTAVIIIAGVFAVIGAFIFLIGNASSDSDN